MIRIFFEQTGGFMGRKVSLQLNLDEIPADQAMNLRRLIDQSDFLNLEEVHAASSQFRDALHYQIRVETDNIRHNVQATDLSMPAALRPLVEELSRLARIKKTG